MRRAGIALQSGSSIQGEASGVITWIVKAGSAAHVETRVQQMLSVSGVRNNNNRIPQHQSGVLLELK